MEEKVAVGEEGEKFLVVAQWWREEWSRNLWWRNEEKYHIFSLIFVILLNALRLDWWRSCEKEKDGRKCS